MKGRVGIYEVMRMTPPLRQLVAKGSSAEARLTSIEEVTSVVSMQD